MTRIGLVGCVKGKSATPAPAWELYTSALFRGRREYVERTCDAWYVLSAKYGLVEPGRILEPYEQTLKSVSRQARREWSRQVVSALRQRVGSLNGTVAEIHAGNEYRTYGLVDGLIAEGAQVEVPVAGLPLGKQLSFYKQRADEPRR
ncbi:hypothetical protein A5756_10600 [Mycobacterium sp. 852002-53434_SCH5985345]|uniref:DUF6884 domain-containing protein n=1 Tax=Mycobacterium sp. 852002-53434_SCH5985345 TaxID=1834107 RepID=UPI0007FDEEBD|nr:DUF6884 domain-containing protein [Mycobacterium sp. 852002-53434_SCH5985345]OBF56732.1 hypothetical protein A5756_10600 [Mycobacterium sp. 852002-53434_SCH5985345]